jgi:mannose-6-phosphate isomerase-like protein (cupin superfamily)
MDLKSTAVIASATGREREGFDDATLGNATWFTLFSSDRTPTAGMSAGVMEIPPNGGILQPHRHGHAEIYFVAAGTGLLTIDGIETPIAAGTAAFIPGDAEHSVRNDSHAVLKIFYVFATDCCGDVVYRFSHKEADRESGTATVSTRR